MLLTINEALTQKKKKKARLLHKGIENVAEFAVTAKRFMWMATESMLTTFTTQIVVVLSRNRLSFYCKSSMTVVFSNLSCFHALLDLTGPHQSWRNISACDDKPMHLNRSVQSFLLSGGQRRAFLPTQVGGDTLGGNVTIVLTVTTHGDQSNQFHLTSVSNCSCFTVSLRAMDVFHLVKY